MISGSSIFKYPALFGGKITDFAVFSESRALLLPSFNCGDLGVISSLGVVNALNNLVNLTAYCKNLFTKILMTNILGLNREVVDQRRRRKVHRINSAATQFQLYCISRM